MALEDQPMKNVSVGGDTFKVPSRGLGEWEMELVNLILEDPHNTPQKAFWIRDWLDNHGPDYSRSIHQNYVAFCTHPTALNLTDSDERVVQPGKYGTTRTMLYLLKRAGAITVVGSEETPNSPVDRNYYDLEEYDHDAWRGPHKYVYGD